MISPLRRRLDCLHAFNGQSISQSRDTPSPGPRIYEQRSCISIPLRSIPPLNPPPSPPARILRPALSPRSAGCSPLSPPVRLRHSILFSTASPVLQHHYVPMMDSPSPPPPRARQISPKRRARDTTTAVGLGAGGGAPGSTAWTSDDRGHAVLQCGAVRCSPKQGRQTSEENEPHLGIRTRKARRRIALSPSSFVLLSSSPDRPGRVCAHDVPPGPNQSVQFRRACPYTCFRAAVCSPPLIKCYFVHRRRPRRCRKYDRVWYSQHPAQ